ncbi:MAG: hypothetical protein E6394_07635, partial [Veillonella sp.]|nr:hypothetical protein [Veillonella sp.]
VTLTGAAMDVVVAHKNAAIIIYCFLFIFYLFDLHSTHSIQHFIFLELLILKNRLSHFIIILNFLP